MDEESARDTRDSLKPSPRTVSVTSPAGRESVWDRFTAVSDRELRGDRFGFCIINNSETLQH